MIDDKDVNTNHKLEECLVANQVVQRFDLVV